MTDIQKIYAERGPMGAIEYLADELEKLKTAKTEPKTEAWQVPPPPVAEEVKDA